MAIFLSTKLLAQTTCDGPVSSPFLGHHKECVSVVPTTRTRNYAHDRSFASEILATFPRRLFRVLNPWIEAVWYRTS